MENKKTVLKILMITLIITAVAAFVLVIGYHFVESSFLDGYFEPKTYVYNSNEKFALQKLLTQKSDTYSVTLKRAFYGRANQCFYVNFSVESNKESAEQLEMKFSEKEPDVKLIINDEVVESDSFIGIVDEGIYNCQSRFIVNDKTMLKSIRLTVEGVELDFTMNEINTAADAQLLGYADKQDYGISFLAVKQSILNLPVYFTVYSDESVFEQVTFNEDLWGEACEFYLEHRLTKEKVPIEYYLEEEYENDKFGWQGYNVYSLAYDIDPELSLSDYDLKYKCIVTASYDYKLDKLLNVSADSVEKPRYELPYGAEVQFEKVEIVDDENNNGKKLLRIEVAQNDKLVSMFNSDDLKIGVVRGDTVQTMSWSGMKNVDDGVHIMYELPIDTDETQFSFCVALDKVSVCCEGEIPLGDVR
ncbi:MAG: hypothetical protein NC110_04715 [Ruminococcus sp.]|nr:hypothetical protein [Ruminococcus sp.]